MTADADPYHWVLEAVEAHEAPLLRYARRLLDDLDLARDAVQHAFVKLCEEPQERLQGHVAPWLFRVCRNKALDHLRRAGRERLLLDAEPVGAAASSMPGTTPVEDPSSISERRDLTQLVRRLLAALPPSQRETIDLWCEGLSYRQIAEITGRHEGHVRVLAHRGLTTLRTHPQIRRLLDATSPALSSGRHA
jgi:RNA polymerase sigma factor (sigma-70 family)